jgi:crotonobetainyl-CoA:carnitine CoA-transferase CaiB-like acyl-CoA transferase
VPFGLAVADLMCGNHFLQGILAALLKRAKTGKGVMVEVSLLESILDVQFEALTIFLNNGGKLADRGNIRGSAHAFLSAPYGIYETSDGFLALAMGNLLLMGSVLEVDLGKYSDKKSWFRSRAAIRKILSKKITSKDSDFWIKVLRANGLWCEKVSNYNDLNNQPFMNDLHLKQTVKNSEGKEMITTRNPIKINENILYSTKAAPKVGEDNVAIHNQFLNN